jgi:hypothetical protein
MADNTVRQLLHDLEKTIHERLQMVDEYIVRRMPDNVLLARIEKLEEEIKQLRQPMIPSNPLVGIEVITKEHPKDLKKDLILEAPDRINEADRLLLNSTARKALEQEEQEEQEDEQQEEQDEQDNEEKDEELFLEKEQEEQQAQVEEEEEVEAEEQAAEEEEEGQEVEEFEYKGATYYRDTEKNVYMLNEEGALTQIGVWSDVKARIIVKKPDA